MALNGKLPTFMNCKKMKSDKKPYYVLLTGSKNNAGDFLIKLRAKALLDWLRPDRDYVDLDAWNSFDEEKLKLVNESQGLILTGGPALQKHMFPNVYALADNLDDITVPIITFGIGWYSAKGFWRDTYEYDLSPKTKALLKKISESGYLSSIRDYHTLNVLQHQGFDNFLMTGCPALYSKEHLNDKFAMPASIKKVGFSLGVSLKDSSRMFKQMQASVLAVIDTFGEGVAVEVVFHHAIGEKYLKTHNASKSLHLAQKKFVNWLDENNIGYVDISGSADNLINYYSQCDLQIGYRVHAHIFMSSISKPSIMLSEDGRGIALRDVISGANLIAYESCLKNKVVRALHKLNVSFDNYRDARNFPEELARLIKYETRYGVKLSQPRTRIDENFAVMDRFLSQLP